VLRTFVSVAVALIVLGGCADELPHEVVEPPEPQRLVIGLIPEQNIFDQYDRYEAVADYLSARGNFEIELKIFPSYGSLIEGFESSSVDGGFMGSFAFALAHERYGVEPLARPVGLDESSTYYGLIFVRKDSGIRQYRDLMGKRFAFVDPLTTAGYLLPLEFFHDFGIRDFRKVFSHSYFAGTHEGAILDVLDGRADIGAAKSTVFARLAAYDSRVGSELVFLAKSREVPENVLVLARDVDSAVKASLERSLLQMHDTERGQEVLTRFGASRFITTTQEDYAAVYDYVADVGLDLAAYDHNNPK